MILFDCGHTLLYEPNFDSLQGSKALLKYASTNTHQLSAKQISDFATDLFHDLSVYARNNGIEIHQHMFQRMLYSYLDIEIDLSPLEMEQIFWNNASVSKKMPHIEETLDYLHVHHIRTGIISNISFSKDALKARIDQLFPNNHFEFIITSSEYVYRKPNPIIFQIALQKAKLTPDKVWYCGDHPKSDIIGAHDCHIFPVWYDNHPDDCTFNPNPDSLTSSDLNFDHLHITDWNELIYSLEAL